MSPTGIPDGYELLVGRSRDKARAALALADERGLKPQEVLTRYDGYLIPIVDGAPDEEFTEIVSDGAGGDPVEVTAEPIETPNESWKNEDIDAWAAEHVPGVDVSGLKKADKIQAILAAIPTLSNKED